MVSQPHFDAECADIFIILQKSPFHGNKIHRGLSMSDQKPSSYLDLENK